MRKINFSEKTKRRFRYGTNSIVLMAVVIVVAVLVNVLLEQLPMSVDLTKEALYSITDTTKKILSELDRDVEIIALYDKVKGESSSSTAQVIKVLDLYDEYDHIKVSYVDMDKDPSAVYNAVGEDRASDYSSGDYIVKCGSNVKRIASSNMFETSTSIDYSTYQYVSTTTGLKVETNVTSAVLYVTSDEIPVVYLSTGNGEATMDSYSMIKQNIETNNFDIKELNLNQADIPDDAVVILFNNPTSDLSTTALNKLKVWFNTKGGNCICLMDYSLQGTEFPNFNDLFALFSMKINNDVVSESEEYHLPGKQQWFTAKTLSPDNSPLENQNTGTAYIFDSRSIELLGKTTTYSESYALVNTSSEAISTSITDGSETVGVKTVVAAGRYQGGSEVSKMLLTGSGANLQDQYITYTGSSTAPGILIRSLNWMYTNTNEGDLIETKKYNTDVISVTQKQANVLGIVGIVVYPLIILIVGGVIWFRRRHL